MFFDLTGRHLCSLAFQLARANIIDMPFNAVKNKQEKIDWVIFLSVILNLNVCQAEATSLSKSNGFNRAEAGRFFDLLQLLLLDHDIPQAKNLQS